MQEQYAVEVENVSKIFHIYNNPADRIKEVFSLGRKKLSTDFTALQDISFKIKKGEFIGIVGKNGAGKSTLLRLLSRELMPTSGIIKTYGRVALLQLGLGFDKELNGIENIRFASKLMGYSDSEIDSMLDNIIEFSELGEFIYYPVKTYSSGMYSRLSFAVGININPDILIADEVLAVGDMRFSQKCLRKMREFKEQGKTLILVSHDTNSINVFCDRAIWIHEGKLLEMGDVKTITTHYTNYMNYNYLPSEVPLKTNVAEQDTSIQTEEQNLKDLSEINNQLDINTEFNFTKNFLIKDILWENTQKFPSVGNGVAYITKFAFYRQSPFERASVLKGDEYVFLFFEVVTTKEIEKPVLGWILKDTHGLVALHTNSDICENSIERLKAQETFFGIFHLKLPFLASGNYIFEISFSDGNEMLHRIHDCLQIQILKTSTQCGYVIIQEQNFREVR